MLVQGYTQDAIIALYSQAAAVKYTNVAAITIVIYDSLILLHRELEYVYRGRQTVIKWIYVLIKLTGLIIFGLNFVAFLVPPQTLTLCFVRHWIAGFFFEIVYTAVIKTLLVLRLRALYGNNKSVTVLLCVATVVELIGTTYAYMFTGLNLQRFVASPAPVPGCTLKPGAHLRLYRSLTLVWATRFASNSFELVLLLYGLYQSLKETGSYFRKGWARTKEVAPILYVFYRDGTVFYIPVCGLSIFGVVATLTHLSHKLTCSNWEAWLGITYYIVGTRLILNTRQAGLKFSTSMLTGQRLTSFPYHLDGEPTTNGDSATSECYRMRGEIVPEIPRDTKGGVSNE